jgi:ketopantoate reductase
VALVAAAYGIGVSDVERREIFTALLDPNGAGANTTSMCRDLAAGRSSEVDFIYGRVIAMGGRARHFDTADNAGRLD